MLKFAEPRTIVLRDYQAAAIDTLRDRIRGGTRRLILCAGTGAGKTLTSASMLKDAANKGSYVLFIVDRIALVDQTSAVFDEYGIPHGVVQGDHPRWQPHENVQVCSAQTLGRRSLPRAPNLIVVDEAHCQIKSTLELMARYPDAVKVGLTATPFTAGMAEHWDGMVNIIPTRALIDSGYLVEPKIYIARSPDDAELGRNSFGEFSDESAASAGIRIVGDVVTEWITKTQEHFDGPVKTIVFSPTVDHGRELCAAFNAAGFNFQQISYLDKSDAERADKIAEFRRPDSLIHGLVSCGVLTKGFDVEDIRCGISCKPYRKSLSSHMQEIGRIMRSIPGEVKKAIWLDHSGNIERFAVDMYDVWENGAGELSHAQKRDSIARERNEKTRDKVVCPECSGSLRGNTCMSCGWERPARSNIHAVEGEMVEFDPAMLGVRPGLRAECLSNPRKVWEGALAYCSMHTQSGEDKARRWAYGIFRGVYPNKKLGFGWYDQPIPSSFDPNAFALAEREAKRFRKGAGQGRAA